MANQRQNGIRDLSKNINILLLIKKKEPWLFSKPILIEMSGLYSFFGLSFSPKK